MKYTRRLLILAALSLFVVFPTTAYLCGTERWAVKVAKDANVKILFVNDKVSSGELDPAVHTTIKDLREQVRPGPLSLHRPRFMDSEAETTIWEVNATLIEYKEEKGAHGDNDYHLVIRDNNGRTMIAEIPKQNCLSQTPQPLRNMIKQARRDFDDHFTGSERVTGSFKHTNTKVRITGPGFFDRAHASGNAPNGIEIHPVIKIEFLN